MHFTDIRAPRALKLCISSWSIDTYYELFLFSRKLFTTDLKACHAFLSVSLMTPLKCSSFLKLLIPGPSKIPAFNFALLTCGNFCLMKANAGLSLLMVLIRFFINPSFTWIGGSSILWGLTNGWATTLCESGWSVFLVGHSFCV